MTIGQVPGLGAILADESLTGGAYELFETATPVGVGPPLHVHRDRDEAFYVISGCYGLWCDDQVREAGPGTFLLVPRGAVHRFEARTDGSKLLFIVSPAGLEGFFRDGAELRAAGRPDMGVRNELANRYDSHPCSGGA